MSALGQKQTLRQLQPMSALPPKADIGTQLRDVRFVPKADILRCGKETPLFDHLIGDGKYARRNSQAEHPRGVDVDSKLELASLYDRQVRWLGTL